MKLDKQLADRLRGHMDSIDKYEDFIDEETIEIAEIAHNLRSQRWSEEFRRMCAVVGHVVGHGTCIDNARQSANIPRSIRVAMHL